MPSKHLKNLTTTTVESVCFVAIAAYKDIGELGLEQYFGLLVHIMLFSLEVLLLLSLTDKKT